MQQSCIRTIGCVSLLLLIVVGTAIAQKASPARIPNGFYAVLSEGSSRDKVRTDSVPNIVLLYDGKYVDSSQTASPSFVALDTVSFVPLILEGSPTASKDGNGRTLLGVTLSRKYIRRLEDFTKAHLGGRVAIVLDGEIITMHKIRSVISEGKIQITRCYDNACELLLSKLTR
jgi:preprotein translocase subunit SecD